jgi:hypothetical protein
MSNKTKNGAKAILSRTAPPPGTPDSQSTMRGREFATKMVNEFGSEELADALRGFHQGIISHLKEMKAKLDQATQHILNAEDVLNP